MAIGAVALNLVSVAPKANEVTAKSAPLEIDGGEATPADRDYDKQIIDLKHEIEALQVQLSMAKDSSASDEVAALRKEVEALKQSKSNVAPKAADGEDAVELVTNS